MSKDIDDLDRKILRLLQKDASQPVAELADQAGLSANACWRRIKQMEASGMIRGRVALLDGTALGLGVTVYVAIKTSQHTADWSNTFTKAVARIPEVVEFHRMSGEVDYMLKVVVADIVDYDRVYKKLIAAAPLSDVSSAFAMETIKSTTALPV